MSSLVISNLRQEDGYWKATIGRGAESFDVDCRYGSWQTTVPEFRQRDTGHHDQRLARRLEDPEFRAEFERQYTVNVRREVTRLVAQELQAKVLFLERKARKADAA